MLQPHGASVQRAGHIQPQWVRGGRGSELPERARKEQQLDGGVRHLLSRRRCLGGADDEHL